MDAFKNAIKVRVTADFLADNPAFSEHLKEGQVILVNTVIVQEEVNLLAGANDAGGPGPHPTKPPTE